MPPRWLDVPRKCLEDTMVASDDAFDGPMTTLVGRPLPIGRSTARDPAATFDLPIAAVRLLARTDTRESA